MANELSTVQKLEGMMKELITINMETSVKVENIGAKVNAVEQRMNEFENNSELTTQQRNNVRHTVSKQVYKLLELPERKSDWSREDRVKAKKYSQLFHQRCYSEVSKKGHLYSPYGTTISQNYIQAIKDIEAWTPSNSVAGLMREADDNAYATRVAKEQGYTN